MKFVVSTQRLFVLHFLIVAVVAPVAWSFTITSTTSSSESAAAALTGSSRRNKNLIRFSRPHLATHHQLLLQAATTTSEEDFSAPPAAAVVAEAARTADNSKINDDGVAARVAIIPRSVRRVEKFARLPVWPFWNGVFIWLIGQVLGYPVAARLEHAITGRVCPNFFSDLAETSPFIMLVHHCHSFSAFDPLRFIQRTFFPEGFPAHPHRGFVTVTYILDGGFVHRDSVGVKQRYGAIDRLHHGKHTQWLVTGRGMLHEEMFDVGDDGLFSRQELYQIWLNVPRKHKMDTPTSYLLGGDDETPLVLLEEASETLVLAGTYRGQKAAAPALTDMALFHVRLLSMGADWTYSIPANYETAIIYVRTGSLRSADGTEIPVHHTAYFDKAGTCLTVTATAAEGADFMVLAGAPIREPCVASGSMVMTDASEIEQAYIDYQRGLFGTPWDHKISDAAWEDHVRQFGSRLR
jgi:redox-sensitive bicupin YhaK (pirin superfamily)